MAVIGLGESGLAMARWLGRQRRARDGARQPRSPPSEAGPARATARRRGWSPASSRSDGSMPRIADLLAWSPGLSPLIGARRVAAPRGDRRRHCRCSARLDFFADELERRRAPAATSPKVSRSPAPTARPRSRNWPGTCAARPGSTCRPPATSAPRCSTRCASDRRRPPARGLGARAVQLPAGAGRPASPHALKCTPRSCSTSARITSTGTRRWRDYRESKLRIHRATACCVVNADDPPDGSAGPATAAAGAAEAATRGRRAVLQPAPSVRAPPRPAKPARRTGRRQAQLLACAAVVRARLRHGPRRRPRPGWWRRCRTTTTAPAGAAARRIHRLSPEPADAGRRAAAPRRPQPCQCAGRA